MGRKFCTTHTMRSNSTYSKQRKSRYADRYGVFKEGAQVSPDEIAGIKIWYRDKREEKDGQAESGDQVRSVRTLPSRIRTSRNNPRRAGIS